MIAPKSFMLLAFPILILCGLFFLAALGYGIYSLRKWKQGTTEVTINTNPKHPLLLHFIVIGFTGLTVVGAVLVHLYVDLPSIHVFIKQNPDAFMLREAMKFAFAIMIALGIITIFIGSISVVIWRRVYKLS